MAIIQSGATADLWTINPVSNAGRVTLYDSLGNELLGINKIVLLNQTLDALNETATINLTGQANCSFHTFGTSGTLTISFEATIDGTNWFSVTAATLPTGAQVSSTTGDGVWFLNTSGYKGVRSKVTSFTSGQTQMSMIADPEEHTLGGSSIVTANIGTTGGIALDTTLDNLTISLGAALGSNTQALMGGSVTTASPTYTTGTINPLSLTTAGALRIDGSGVTQPVSGTVTANAGTGNFNVVGTGTAGSPASGVITVQGISGGTPLSVSVSGGAINSDGYVTTAAPSYTNNTFQPLSLTTVGALRVDGSAVTQPISVVSLPLPTGAATETTLTGVLTTTAFQARINTFGQKTMANSTPVVLSSDQSAIPITDNGGSLTVDGVVTANAGTGNFNVIGTGTAGTAATGVVTIQGIAGGVAIPVSGTVTATNPSVSTTGSAVPASATYIGGEVTTAAPTYTNATMDALSLTTTGLLRVDGSNVTQPVSGTVTANAGTGNYNNSAISTTGTAPPASAIYLGGSVTTAAPTYTTGQMSALSLTTSGLLRVDVSGSTSTVAGGKSNNAVVPGATNLGVLPGLANAAAPTWTEGNQVTLSTLLTGALRIDNTSWLGSTAPTVGSKTSANSIPVVIASDQGSITVNASATVGVVDNAAFTDGTTRVQPSGFIFDETAGTALTENDAAAARIDSKRAQIGVIEDGTTRGVRSAVKAASTAAVAADPALVVAVSPNNSIAITQKVTTSTLNATTTPLGISGVYTGTGESTLSVNAIQVNVFTNKNSAVNGLQIQQSMDNTNWDIIDSFTVLANVGQGITVQATAEFYRIVYTNGTSAQATFRLESVLCPLADALPRSIGQKTSAGSLSVVLASDQPASSVKSTIKPLYGTSNQTVTITLASLANAAARASTSIDNTSTLYDDVYIFLKYTTAAAATSATGYINVYGYGTVDGGTTYPESITGTDAGVTLSAPPNLTLIAQATANANSKTYTFGPFSFCRMYGLDRLPARWGVVFVNKSGATLNATAGNFAVTYQGVNGNLV